jgi:hypothetical protein
MPDQKPEALTDDELRELIEESAGDLLPDETIEAMARAILAHRARISLELKAGAVYRNETGGELHAVQQMQYLTHGSLMRMPGVIFGEVWLMESRSNEWGTVPYLCTPDGLHQHGYRLAEKVAGDA